MSNSLRMKLLNFDRLPKLFSGDITNIQWKYEQPNWLLDDIIFTILFEVNKRLFCITANKNNLIEILKRTHIVGPLQEIEVDVSGCFLKSSQPLLWKDFFRLYFNLQHAEMVIRNSIRVDKFYKTVNLKSWNYFESPFNDDDRDDIFDNIQTLTIKYFLDDILFKYEIEKFDLMSILSRSNLVNFTLYHSLKAYTEGAYNNKGEWVDWQTYFNREFTDVSAMTVLKEFMLCGCHK